MPETLYLTCNLIDRYLAIRNVTRKRLQLVRWCVCWCVCAGRVRAMPGCRRVPRVLRTRTRATRHAPRAPLQRRWASLPC
jgi:hypothetical protein